MVECAVCKGMRAAIEKARAAVIFQCGVGFEVASSDIGVAVSDQKAARIVGGAVADELAIGDCERSAFRAVAEPKAAAPSRCIVDEEAVDEVSKMKVDSPEKSGDHIGPVVSKFQYDKIINLIELGKKEGANLAIGGSNRPQDLGKGYYIQPTIFTNVTNEMEIAKSEIFGPVLSIIPFDSEEEAIQIVNDTEYGLGNYIQTSDMEKARRVAKRLRSGVVYINGHSMDSGTPFGGYRQSGNGREGGKWGLDEYLEVKTITGWV